MPDEQEEVLRPCDQCGATVYPEHLAEGKAAEVDGKLLCKYCLEDYRAAHAAAEEAVEVVDEPIPLSTDGPAVSRSKIHSFGAAPGGMADSMAGQAALRDQDLKRPLLRNSPNATRCRTFHCKLTDASLTHMNDMINEWVDGDETVEIKFATSTIGVVEGKHADQHLIVTVFY